MEQYKSLGTIKINQDAEVAQRISLSLISRRKNTWGALNLKGRNIQIN